jgi:hypothetical protein
MKGMDIHRKLRDLSRKPCSSDLVRGVYGICISKTHEFGAAVEITKKNKNDVKNASII